MPAFNFKKSFAEEIRSGRKRQTIRSKYNEKHELSRRHWPNIGSELQLYTGMRTKSCAKILSHFPSCTLLNDVEFYLGDDCFESILIDDKLLPGKDANAFASADGFTDIDQMFRFWQMHLKHVLRDGHFSGYLIGWPCTCQFVFQPTEHGSLLYCERCDGVTPKG